MDSKFKHKYQKYKNKYRTAKLQYGGIDPHAQANTILNADNNAGDVPDGTQLFIRLLKEFIGDNEALFFPRPAGGNYNYYLGNPGDQYPHFHPASNEDRGNPKFIFSAPNGNRIEIDTGNSVQGRGAGQGRGRGRGRGAGQGRGRGRGRGGNIQANGTNGISPTTVHQIITNMAGVGVEVRIKNYLILLLIILRDHGDQARQIINGNFPDDDQHRDVFRENIFTNFGPCRQGAWTRNLDRISNILVTVFRNFCELNLGGYTPLTQEQLDQIYVGGETLQDQFQQLVGVTGQETPNSLVRVEQSPGCLDGKWRERLRNYYDQKYDAPGQGAEKKRNRFNIKRNTYMGMVNHGYNRRTLRGDVGDCSDTHIRAILNETPNGEYWVPNNRFYPPIPQPTDIRRKRAGQVLKLSGNPKTKTGSLNRDSYCHFRGWQRCGDADEHGDRQCEGDLINQDFIDGENQDWVDTQDIIDW